MDVESAVVACEMNIGSRISQYFLVSIHCIWNEVIGKSIQPKTRCFQTYPAADNKWGATWKNIKCFWWMTKQKSSK